MSDHCRRHSSDSGRSPAKMEITQNGRHSSLAASSNFRTCALVRIRTFFRGSSIRRTSDFLSPTNGFSASYFFALAKENTAESRRRNVFPVTTRTPRASSQIVISSALEAGDEPIPKCGGKTVQPTSGISEVAIASLVQRLFLEQKRGNNLPNGSRRLQLAKLRQIKCDRVVDRLPISREFRIAEARDAVILALNAALLSEGLCSLFRPQSFPLTTRFCPSVHDPSVAAIRVNSPTDVWPLPLPRPILHLVVSEEFCKKKVGHGRDGSDQATRTQRKP